MKQTPLSAEHKKLGARLIEFAGWEMPLSYRGVLEEHRAVRTSCGLFDISHMGRFEITGKGSSDLLQWVTTNDVKRLDPGCAHYSLLCTASGGIIDDIFVYKMADDRYLLCVNASNREKDLHWIQKAGHSDTVDVVDVSERMAQIALQGPNSKEVLHQSFKGLADPPIGTLRPRQHRSVTLAGIQAVIARTGYTGEYGYEIYCDAKGSVRAWTALLEKGKAQGLIPCGLGARDTLRLEMGYALYGHEIDESTTPIEAGLDSAVSFDKTPFCGKEALLSQKERGPERKLVGFLLLQDGIPREGCLIFSGKTRIGTVTSGNFSPLLKKGIGMGYVQTLYAKPGVEILIDIRGKTVLGVIAERPFYRKR